MHNMLQKKIHKYTTVRYCRKSFCNFFGNHYNRSSGLYLKSYSNLDNNLTSLSFFNYAYNLGVHLAVDPDYTWIGGPNHDVVGDKHVEYYDQPNLEVAGDANPSADTLDTQSKGKGRGKI